MRVKSFGTPLLISVLVCFAGGWAIASAEDWIRQTPPGDSLDLALGLGFMGLFPGLAWGWLEQRESRRGPAAPAVRRQLLGMTLGGAVGLAVIAAALFAALPAVFSNVMAAVGFKVPATDLTRWAATGFVGGGALGAFVGFTAGWLRGLLRSNS